MTRAAWPSRYANIPIDVIRNKAIPYAAFRFYCCLRALAWGKPELKIDLDKLIAETGFSRSRVLEYARVLRSCSALLWRCTGNAFECSFPEPESRIPVFQDSRINDLHSSSKTDSSKSLVDEESSSESRKPGSGIPATVPPSKRAQLESLFIQLTGIPAPARGTDRERGQAGARWWAPLRRMLEVAGEDAPSLLRATVAKMRGEGLTISAPQSLEKVFLSLYGQRQAAVSAEGDYQPATFRVSN